MKKVILPYEGWPETHIKRDKAGNLTANITVEVLTPQRAKVADFLSSISALGLFAGGLWSLATRAYTPEWPEFALLLGGPFVAAPLVQRVWRGLFKKTTEFVFTPTRFKVKRTLGWKVYDRVRPHKFVPLEHDKARREQEHHAYLDRIDQTHRRVTRRTRYYGDSFHIVFVYEGQRQDVVTVFGRKEAQAVLDRFIRIDQIMNNEIGMGDEAASHPHDQWGDDTTGDIP